ncbi:hypothetical protein [Trueperella pyogenes]|uniref:hypothetical protein n=1 Tax=Trueperella pyogenes TaxID=1661 RepID=UPI00324374B7
MGNRATLVFKNTPFIIQLQWNGGRDSIEGFLTYARLKKLYPGVLHSSETKWTDIAPFTRFTTILTNFFGNSGLHVYPLYYPPTVPTDPKFLNEICDGDNGTYLIENWQIVGRYGIPEGFQEQNHHPLADFLRAVNNAQPEEDRLTEEQISQLEK